MNTRTLLAWLIILSLSPVCIEAKTGKNRAPSKKTASKPSTPEKKKSGARLTGRLTADGPILVNGNKATSGETVYSGAKIETPAGIGATVQLGALGQMDLGPLTSLTLIYDREVIRGEVVKGCATVVAVKGVTGFLALPGGITKRTDPLIGETISTCTYDNGGVIGANGTRCTTTRAAVADDDDDWKLWALLIAGGGALAGGIVAATNGDSPCINASLSPFTPCR
jgi:hypothetical protein